MAKLRGPGAPKARRQVLAKPRGFAKDDGGNRQGSPRRAPISRKPLRREGRCDHRLYLWSRACAVFSAREPRVQRPPGLPCALTIFRGHVSSKARAQRAARTRTYILDQHLRGLTRAMPTLTAPAYSPRGRSDMRGAPSKVVPDVASAFALLTRADTSLIAATCLPGRSPRV